MSLMSFSPVSRWLASPLFGLLLVVFTEVKAASLLCGGVKQTQEEDKRGRSLMIGSSQRIVSALGDDVILPCRVEPQLNVENLTVEWWKPDIQFDPEDPLINYRYVHVYNENRDEEDMKMLRYKGRTALNKDGLKHGDISLKIMNVRQSDQGRYRCEIPQLASPSVIMLVVVTSWTTETPLAPTVNHQTPDPNDGTNVKGDGTDVKGGWIDLIVMISFLVLILGVAGYLLRHELYGVCRRLNRTSSSLGSFPRVTFNGAQRVPASHKWTDRISSITDTDRCRGVPTYGQHGGQLLHDWNRPLSDKTASRPRPEGTGETPEFWSETITSALCE